MDIGKLSASVTLATGGFTGGVNTVVSGLGKMGGAAIALNQTFELVKNTSRLLESTIKNITSPFIDAAKVAENYRVRLDVMLRSQAEGARMFSEMAKYAEGSVAQFEHIMEAATALSGVMKGGVDEVKAWMPLIDDLAAASGLSIQETTSQVIRMYSAGAQAADLFRERGILAMLGFKAGAEYSIKETRQMLAQAWEMPDSKFRDASKKLAATWDGLVGMLYDKWFLFRNEVMNTGGLFEGLKAGVKSLVDKIDEMKATGDLSKWAATMAQGFIESIDVMGSSVLKLGEKFTQFKSAWSSVMTWDTKRDIQDLLAEMAPIQARIDANRKIIEGQRPNWEVSQEALKKDTEILAEKQRQLDRLNKDLEEYARNIANAADQEKAWRAALDGLKERVKLMREAAEAAQRLSILTETERMHLERTWSNKGGGTSGNPSDFANSNIEATQEQEKALKRLEAQWDKLKTEIQSLPLPDMAAQLKAIDAQTAAWIKTNEKLIKDFPKLEWAIKGISQDEKGLAQAKALKDQVRALDDQINELSFQKTIVGMTDYEKAIAQVAIQADKAFQALERMYGAPGAEGSLAWPEEITGRIKVALDAGKANIQANDLQKIKDQIRDANFDNSLLGLTDQQKIVAQINFEMEKLGNKTPEVTAAFKELQNIRLDGLHLQVMANIKEMTNWENRINEVFKNFQNPMQDFLMKFAETGKLSFKELGAAFVKELRLMAAKYAAEMMMISLKEGVLGLVSLVSNDGKSGQHFAAAAAAAAAAPAFIGFIAGSGLAGMAHDGINSIPERGTWLLDKGERVVGEKTNRDLTTFLKEGGKPGNTVILHNTFQGGDKDSILEAMPIIERRILEVVNSDIANNGETRRTIISYTQ